MRARGIPLFLRHIRVHRCLSVVLFLLVVATLRRVHLRFFFVCLAVLSSVPGHAEEATVVDDATAYRYQLSFRAPVVGRGGKIEMDAAPPDNWVLRGGDVATPTPPANWTAPPFDDSAWPTGAGPLLGEYGMSRPAGAALICVRLPLSVRDPQAAGLTLSLRYRGGAVVYLNGEEIARRHLPDGKLDPLALADDYPIDAFVTEDGESLLPNFGKNTPPAAELKRYELRIRELEVDLPATLLKQGGNALAIELHRSAIPPDLPPFGRGAWDTVGLVGWKVTAANAKAVTLPGAKGGEVQLWAAAPWLRLDESELPSAPAGSVPQVAMFAPLGGVGSGQIVASSAAPFSGLSAKIGALKSEDGARLPTETIRIRYPRLGDGFLPLLDRPTKEAAVQPIWLTAEVPADAAPGVYRGALTVTLPEKSVEVPVELAVFDWNVGPPSEWKTCVNLLQSPESVARYYGVPLWSDRHFQLMEKSFALMGAAGNDVLGVSAVGKNVFGDDPLVVFRREGKELKPELKFLRRYLEHYDRHAAPPQFLSLHVWSYGMYQRGEGRDGGKEEHRAETIPVIVLKSNPPSPSGRGAGGEGSELVPIEAPMFGKPGTEATWQAVCDGVYEEMKRLKWNDTRLLLGTSGDTWPSEETVSFFQKIAPRAQWRVLTHGGGCPRWGVSDHERIQPNGMVVGYLEIARRLENHRVKLPEHPVPCNARDKVGSHPLTYRGLPMINTIVTNYDGICWKGIDYWTFVTEGGMKRNALNSYVHFGNMVGGTPRAIATPGEHGAVATVQYEMLREGLQECEAALAVRRRLARLYPQPVETYDVAAISLEGGLLRSKNKDGAKPSEPRVLDLALLLDEEGKLVRILPTARTYNTGRHSAEFEVADWSPEAVKLQAKVHIGDDRWVKGGEGEYTISFAREGDAYRGRYEGRYRGIERKGAVSGAFVPQGLTEKIGQAPPETDLSRRAKAAIDRASAAMQASARGGGGDIAAAARELYAVAAELAKAGPN